ncbi:MAG TPA: polysaccharide deacetylase family protein, partial [Pyrinomonadaceae bacterium]|nr:polysaccharide deacetylase family protein [Pyrinomonadaceae bacterium]
MLTIVMYHYVRDLANSDYPDIKGLKTEDFDGQLDYLQKHYTVLDINEVARAAASGASLEPNGCLLTFDDGFIDHYETVFPRLRARGLTGSFYPSKSPLTRNIVLDVHKIQFIVGSGHAPVQIKERLGEEIDLLRNEMSLPSNAELYATYAIANRYAEAEVAFIKGVLQKGLPEAARARIASRLFSEFVSSDEESFSQSLYMSTPQLREMVRAGMAIGGHGSHHRWLGTLSREEQELEIDETRDFLEGIYEQPVDNWVMCYPYGDYTQTTLEILRSRGAALGLTNKCNLVPNLANPL